MKNLGLMIRLTVKEVIRSTTYGFLVLFSLISTASANVFLNLSLQEQDKFFKDISLASITLFSLIFASLLGASQIHSDFETKTIYHIFTNPIRKWTYVLGRFMGLSLLIGFAMALMTFVFYLTLGFQSLKPLLSDFDAALSFTDMLHTFGKTILANLPLTKVFTAIYLQSLMICVVSMTLSSLFSVPMAITGSMIIFFAGHMSHFVTQMAFAINQILGYLISLALLWVPNFENFNIADTATLGHAVSVGYLGWLVIYSGLSILFFLTIAYQCILNKTADL